MRNGKIYMVVYMGIGKSRLLPHQGFMHVELNSDFKKIKEAEMIQQEMDLNLDFVHIMTGILNRTKLYMKDF